MTDAPTPGWPTVRDNAEPIRVLIVDDHPVFRDGLRLLLAEDEWIVVVGVSANGAEVITAAHDLQPDVVVMDIDMPEINGVEATRRIISDSPHIGVLMLTMFDDDESVFSAMRAGARGYLLKGADPAEISRAVIAVGHGTAIFGPSIALRLIDYFADHKTDNARAFPELTDREREILSLDADGTNNTTIARQLYLSPKTVRNHVSNIFSKLHAADRADAILRARRAGLGHD